MMLLNAKSFTTLSSSIVSMRQNVIAIRKTVANNKKNEQKTKQRTLQTERKLEETKSRNAKEAASEEKKQTKKGIGKLGDKLLKKPEMAFRIPGISVLTATISFISFGLLGWMLKALPAIQKSVSEFIKKAKEFIKSLEIFWNVIKSGFSLLFSVVEDLFKKIGFGGTDGLKEGDEEKTKKLIGDLVDSLKTLQQQLPQRFAEFSAQLAMAFGKAQKGELPGMSGSGDVSGMGGDAEAYRVAAAISTEAGRGQAAADVMQVVANRVADSGYPNNYTDVLAQPDMFQGVFTRDLNQFRRIKTLEDAARWAGTTTSVIQGYLSDLKNPTYVAKSKEVRGALEFRGAPALIKQENRVRPGTHAAGPSGRFSDSMWRGTSMDNQFLLGPQDPMRSGGAVNYSLDITGQSAAPVIPAPAQIENNASENRAEVASGLNGGSKKITIDKEVIVPITLPKERREKYQQSFAAASSIKIEVVSVDGHTFEDEIF